ALHRRGRSILVANAEELIARRHVDAAIRNRRAAVHLDIRNAVAGGEELLMLLHTLLVDRLENQEPGKDVPHVDLAVGQYRQPASVAAIAKLPELLAGLWLEAVERPGIIWHVEPVLLRVEDRRGIACLYSVLLPDELRLTVGNRAGVDAHEPALHI